MLARFHEGGWDRARDPALAAAWYRRDAEAGDFRAQYNLATLMAQHGSPDVLAQAGAALRASGDPALWAGAGHALGLAKHRQPLRRSPSSCSGKA